MSDDELRRAAERLVGEAWHDYGPVGNPHDDGIAVARAWLAEQTYTATPPTEPGRYWHRFHAGDDEPTVERVLNNKTMWGWGGWTAAEVGGEWAGPIRPPA